MQRVESLLLLSGCRRVVIEIDGKQHYAGLDLKVSRRRTSPTPQGTADSGYLAMKCSGSVAGVGGTRGCERCQVVLLQGRIPG